MISNYIKLAWRILSRKKFFSFITLFGISFTLGILMVILSFVQSELGKNAPLSKKSDFVFVEQIQLRKTYYDTITTIDTIVRDHAEVYDTTYEYKEKGSGRSQSEININLAQKYLTNINSAEDFTIFNWSNTNDVFVNGVKLSLQILLGDPSYLNIFDHVILEGRNFDQQEMENGSPVIVISTKTAEGYFGTDKNVIDKIIEVNGINYKVIGLYEHKGKVVPFVSPDGIVPYTTTDLTRNDNFYFGGFSMMFLKKSDVSSKVIKQEINDAATKVPIDHPDNNYRYDEVAFVPSTYDEMFAQGVYWDDDPEKSYNMMKWILFALLLFFILLPTLNLINLNVSRIMDRSSEIGVRKAFGAHNGNIIWQFIIENIVQTFIGGILGLGIALFLINLINEGGFLGNAILNFNLKFFVYSFIATLVFGIFSGLLPAYKMSKLHIVKALKENQL